MIKKQLNGTYLLENDFLKYVLDMLSHFSKCHFLYTCVYRHFLLTRHNLVHRCPCIWIVYMLDPCRRWCVPSIVYTVYDKVSFPLKVMVYLCQ